MESTLIYQGAEAKLFLSNYFSKKVVIKERLRKSYRLPELDNKINKQRILQEIRCNVKCRKAGVKTPTIYNVNQNKLQIIFEYIPGITVKEYISRTNDQQKLIELGNIIGKSIGKMHYTDVVHGDLTTSNMMIVENESEIHDIILIDFGLGMTRPVIEDKAVDLYVLERALISTHPGIEYLIDVILDSYQKTWEKSNSVLQRLEQVRQRGRKRDMIG